MSVTIKLPQFLQYLANDRKEIKVEGTTVGECLKELIKEYPVFKEKLLDDKGKLLRAIDVYVNGQSAYPEELKKKVKDGDELYIMMVIAGG